MKKINNALLVFLLASCLISWLFVFLNSYQHEFIVNLPNEDVSSRDLVKITTATTVLACDWQPAKFLIISDNVFGVLVYYSHLLSIIVALVLITLVLTQKDKKLLHWTFIATQLFLFVWVFADLVLWATDSLGSVMFFWGTTILFEPLVYAGLLLFFIQYVFKRRPNFKEILSVSLLLLPTILFSSSNYAVQSFDLTNCDREVVEGLLVYYGYITEVLFAIAIILYGAVGFLRTSEKKERKNIIYISLGSILFLFAFSFGNIVGSFTEDWTLGQIGLIGVPIFGIFITYLIVEFKAFNIKLLATQALVVSIFILLGSMLFIRTIENIQYVIIATLVVFLFVSRALVKSVKIVDEQKEALEKANQAQSDVLHFMSHQVKGFLTNTKAALSMVLEGDYGPVSKPVHDVIEQAFVSEDRGVTMVQSFLNASRIDQNSVEYEVKQFDLKKMVEEVLRGEEPLVKEKGLTLVTKIAPDTVYTMAGDQVKFREVVFNLIDNAVRYTPSGTIEVSLWRFGNMIRFSVKDSGVGIPESDRARIFTKYGYGKESRKVNVHSNGLGLYLVKNVVETHKGKVWYESEGAGKGTTFIVEVKGV